ncbi:NUDIX hydrolase [Rubinisphaera margarita]|uniref:NUDIX hydrolase n=1 Tax=Rubinisphaera margarita TaxID=2909586 RepID=UPI001EE7A73B|nr:NUDIX domain-containing protein [Rubinisphaera margarita]MCG6155748.1 NUDIX domain-containing protein [Rubinisphaera margarita]
MSECDRQTGEEWFDIVDPQDNVLRSAPRSVVHGGKHLHRATHIWVFNSTGQLLIHKRTAEKEEEPLRWTSSAAGHVSAGEDYEPAAQRELHEELALDGTLFRMHKIFAGPDVGYEHTVLFGCRTDAKPTPDPREILEYRFMDPAEVARWVEESPSDFTHPFRALIRWYQQSQ